MKNKKILALCLTGLLFSCGSQKVVNSVSSLISSNENTSSQISLEGDSITSNVSITNNVTTEENKTSSVGVSSNPVIISSGGTTNNITSSITSDNSHVSSETTSNNNSSSLVSSNISSNTNVSVDYSSDYGGYYKSITSSMTGGTNGSLRKALTELIDNPKTYSYSKNNSNCLGHLLSTTDVDSDGKMVLFYSQDKITPEDSGRWNREHVWPQSLSGGLYGTSGPGSDMHHIRPTATNTNSNRGNLKYGNVNHSSATESLNSTYKTYTLSGWYDKDYFEPLDTVKGDAARICLYMYTCYYASGKLNLTNVAKDIKTLVDWSNLDLPSEQEKIRNEKVYELQGNRNPYIDHPEWVNKIFGDGSSLPPSTSSSEVVTSNGVTSFSPSTNTGTSIDISHEEGLTCTFSSASIKGTTFTDSNGKTWTSTVGANGYDNTNNRGIQFTVSSIGNGNTMTFESNESINDVCNIELTYGTNGTVCQIEVLVGSTSIGTLNTTSTTSGSTKTLTFSSGSLLTGNVKLKITPNGSKNSIWIKQIVIK